MQQHFFNNIPICSRQSYGTVEVISWSCSFSWLNRGKLRIQLLNMKTVYYNWLKIDVCLHENILIFHFC